MSSTSSSAAIPLSTNFWIKVVGGSFDGTYLSTRSQILDDGLLMPGIITATLGQSVPAVFSIDPATQLLIAKLDVFPVSYGIYSKGGVHAQLNTQFYPYPYHSSMTLILCKDLDGYLNCATPDQSLNVFAAEGDWTYLTSQSYESANSPEYVGVKYQIVYQPISVASSTTASLTQPPSSLDAYDMITSKHLEEFCTSYLGYTTQSITETTTLYANATKTAFYNSTTISTIAASTTETSIAEIITQTSTLIISAAFPAPTQKRALETPAALKPYSEGAISSGCSRVATRPATMTISETHRATKFQVVNTTMIMTAYETDLATITQLATSTWTTTATSTLAPSPTSFLLQGNGLSTMPNWNYYVVITGSAGGYMYSAGGNANEQKASTFTLSPEGYLTWTTSKGISVVLVTLSGVPPIDVRIGWTTVAYAAKLGYALVTCEPIAAGMPLVCAVGGRQLWFDDTSGGLGASYNTKPFALIVIQ